MDPVSVGAAIVVLGGTKAIEKLGSMAAESGWGAFGRALGRLRGFFVDTDDEAAAELEAFLAAEAADPERAVAVGELIDTKLAAAPKIKAEVEELLAVARRDAEIADLLADAMDTGGVAHQVTMIAIGNDNIQVPNASGPVNIRINRAP